MPYFDLFYQSFLHLFKIMNMKKQIFSLFGVLIFCVLATSCNNGGNEQESDGRDNNMEEEVTPVDDLAEFRFTYTIANLPPPMKVLDEFSKSNMPADVSLLNPVANAKKYESSSKKALNYGIYGVDLAYAVFNERTPEILKYYPVVRNLAEQLDMTETFNRFTSRFDEYSENRDTLRKVIDDMYAATDAYLRSNERLTTASEILAASWLEAQYLTVTSLLEVERNQNNDIMFQRVWEQRLYLDNITSLLGEFENDEMMQKIKTDYEELLIIYQEPQNKDEVDQALLMKLAAKLTEIRSYIIA